MTGFYFITWGGIYLRESSTWWQLFKLLIVKHQSLGEIGLIVCCSLRASPAVLSMSSCRVKLDEEKLNYAKLG